jgi:ornithine cyclodeaminase
VLVGRHPGRPDPDAIVVVNPFGMAILDVAIAEQVRGVAEQRDIGLLLPL